MTGEEFEQTRTASLAPMSSLYRVLWSTTQGKVPDDAQAYAANVRAQLDRVVSALQPILGMS